MSAAVDQKAWRQIRWVLEKIYMGSKLALPDGSFEYEMTVESGSQDRGESPPNASQQIKIIRWLGNQGVVRYIDIYQPPFDRASGPTLGIPPSAFLLHLVQPAFDQIYQKYQRTIDGSILPTGENDKTEFSAEKSLIKYQDKICSLPPYKHEFDFCKKAYSSDPLVPIEWQDLYEAVYEKEFLGEGNEKKKIYDVMSLLNKRIQKTLGIENLFVWQEKTIRRRL